MNPFFNLIVKILGNGPICLQALVDSLEDNGFSSVLRQLEDCRDEGQIDWNDEDEIVRLA